MRVLPNRAKPNQVQSRIRRGPHARTHLLWSFLLGSLIADPLIPLITTPQIPLELATAVAALCALMSIPFIAQTSLHSLLSRLRHMHAESLKGSRGLAYGLTGAAIIFLFGKGLMATKVPTIFGIAFILIFASGLRSYATKFLKQAAEDKKLFESNPWAQVQRWEQQLIVFVSLPLILARGIGLCGAFADIPPEDASLRFVFLGISALFLGMLQPHRPFFIGYCGRCKHPTPIVFQDMGRCLNCDVGLRMAYHAWINRLPLPPAPSTETKPASTENTGEKPSPSDSRRKNSAQKLSPKAKRTLPLKPR